MTTPITLFDTTPTTTPPEGGFGALKTGKGNLPLHNLDVRLSTTGLAVSTELTQGFSNPYDEPLEATYIFPLPDRAALTSLKMEADDRTIEGVLREREQARTEYDQAVAEGKRAAIAEEERPGVFTMRVGNILPGEHVTIRLTLAGHLGYDDGEATLRFPLVVAPRYIPGNPLTDAPVGSGTELDTDAVPDASRITPPVLLPGFPNPIDLSIAVDIDPAGLPITGVASSLHPVSTEDHDHGRVAVRVHPGERADRDFILRLGLGSDDAVASSLVVVPDEATEDADAEWGEGTFAVTVVPPKLAATARPRDVVLVLDRSGSMGGQKIVAARRAAARIVDTLTSADRFAVLAFDNVVETPPDLADGLIDATDGHRFRAVEYLARLDARGGTEMLPPLLRAAGLLAGNDAERERVLVLVTDGQVGNEDQILRELATRLPDVRIHTVGIDVAVNEGFLRRLATVGGGHCELVESEDRLDEAMEAIHRRIGTPLVTDLAVTPDGLEIVPDSLTPMPLPALYDGAALVLTGRYRADGSPPGAALTVSGRAVDGTPWSDRLTAVPGDNKALAALWVRARLRDLEDRYVTLRTRPGDSRLKELEGLIVDTSLRFGVLCRFTAYVAIDTRVVNEGGQVHRVTQPVDLPHGWQPPGMTSGMRAVAAFAGGAASHMTTYAGQTAQTEPPTVQSLLSAESVRDVFGTPKGRRVRTSPESGPAEPLQLLRDAHRTAADWLRRHRGASAGERGSLLTRLRRELERLIATLTRAGVDALTVRPLEQLLHDLQAYEQIPVPTPADTERIWLRASDVLQAFVRRTPPASQAPRRSRFWSR